MKAMMKWLTITMVWAGAAGPVWAADGLQARVKGERVNLRAQPEAEAEVVAQVTDGVILPVQSTTDEWVEVVPPVDVDLWIASEFVTDDTVLVQKLNARSGASINHSIVGSFTRGEKVVRRGSFGEWLRVAPPANARLWIHRSYVEIVNPAVPVPPPAAAPALVEPAAAPDAGGEAPVETPVLGVHDEPLPVLPPADVRLIPLDGQGREVQREGLLKRSPTLFLKAPGSHRLVRREGNTLVTVAYLRGNENQLNSLLDRQLLIRGREYWTEEVKAPLIVIESIEKRSF